MGLLADLLVEPHLDPLVISLIKVQTQMLIHARTLTSINTYMHTLPMRPFESLKLKR
jgi:hypothetical protein